jgi:hypothetical protein
VLSPFNFHLFWAPYSSWVPWRWRCKILQNMGASIPVYTVSWHKDCHLQKEKNVYIQVLLLEHGDKHTGGILWKFMKLKYDVWDWQ